MDPFTRLYHAVWRNPDFRDLPLGAQWLYLALISAPEVTATGVMTWSPSRLAARTAGLAVADVVEAAADLAGKDFILLDTSTGEVLVRSYVRHAAVLRNPNTAKAVARGYAVVESVRLRGVLVFELNRLAVEKPGLPWGPLVDVLADGSLDPQNLHGLFTAGDPPGPHVAGT